MFPAISLDLLLGKAVFLLTTQVRLEHGLWSVWMGPSDRDLATALDKERCCSRAHFGTLISNFLFVLAFRIERLSTWPRSIALNYC